ncbi:MAG: sodium:solute symporter [Thermonemataceae bacterium]
MDIQLVLSVLIIYFFFLVIIAYLTSRKASTTTFFNADKQSPWYLVAFGMIGASLSGVTFISIPGAVLGSQFSYFQIVLGYIAGYTVIATVLMPLYYKLQLVSIYGYLEQRFGFWTYKTGAAFFLLSRTIGAAFRLFLAVIALQIGLFEAWDFPFWLTAFISIVLVWTYTFKGGIKTVVWTDTLQTTFLLLAMFASIFLIKSELNLNFSALIDTIAESEYSKVFFWKIKDKNNFLKQFFSGMFIAIAMTGLDQDMMQKNLTCRNLPEAQKNVLWFTVVLVVVNFIFLCLGALLYIYATTKAIPLPMKDGQILTDQVYPFLAFNHFSTFAGVAFLLGITAATYSSSDSALTALTTSFCVDFLNINKASQEKKRRTTVRWVHIGFSLLLLLVIVIFKAIKEANPESNVIGALFSAAGYTYGPLLGLYAFGLFTNINVKDRWIPIVCIVCPILSYFIDYYTPQLFEGFSFGFLIILINGMLTFVGLWLCKKEGRA